MRIAVGITGSSGAVYALDFLRKCSATKYLVVSSWGKVLLHDELKMSEKDLKPLVHKIFSDDDLASPLASGSNPVDTVVLLPASSSTIGKIASGIGDTLITRMTQVALKERFKVILCIRETPLSTLMLEQCARLSGYGAIVMPISPPMYFAPTSVDEYVGAFTNKLLQQLGMRTAKGWRADELE